MDFQVNKADERILRDIYIFDCVSIYNTEPGPEHINYSHKMSLYPNQSTSVIIPADLEPIRTSRLYLRPLTVADAAAIFEIRRRQDVADWL